MGINVRDGPALWKEGRMAWIMLTIAGLLEVVWAFTMKQSQGFTRLWPTILTFITMFASFGLLSISMRTLPLGTAYTIWTGIGAVGAFLVGIMVLGEQVSAMRLVAAALIVSGIVLMKLSTSN
jgi:quaternary ammonium compound-resistance protein SugE